MKTMQRLGLLGFDFSVIPKDLQADVALCNSLSETDFEKKELLDNTIFEALKNLYPLDSSIKKVAAKLANDEARIVNDGFNTNLESEVSNPNVQLIDRLTSDIPSRYADRVEHNLGQMGTTHADWKATAIKGFTEVPGPKGKMVQMPVFDFPVGYATAPTLFKADQNNPCCELCGHPKITKVFWLQNDEKKWTLGVGSECITHFMEGKSGLELTREKKLELAQLLSDDLKGLMKALEEKYSAMRWAGAGKTQRHWTDAEAYNLCTKKSKTFIKLFDNGKAPGTMDSLYHVRFYSGENKEQWVKEDREKDLLTWFSRNEKKYVELLEKYSADYDSKYLQQKNKFVKGGEIKSEEEINKSIEHIHKIGFRNLDLYELAEKLRNKLIENLAECYVSSVDTSQTDYGESFYVTVIDQHDENHKFRISDHSVTNYYRIFEEYHIHSEKEINDAIKYLKINIEKRQNAKLIRRKKFDEFEEDNSRRKEIAKLFVDKIIREGKAFFELERTYDDLEKFKIKNPTAENIYQILQNKAYGMQAYKYSWIAQQNGYGQKEMPRSFYDEWIKEKNKFVKGGVINNEITCKCGWSWNTTDSDEHDKYICHKCGFDNSAIKKSNLTPAQQKLVRTPEFKAWFGDWENDAANASKVVDENGEPMVVYHGTLNGGFNVFNLGKITDEEFDNLWGSQIRGGADPISFMGSHFAKEKSIAEMFTSKIYSHNGDKGMLYSVFINIRNPLKITEKKLQDVIIKQNMWDDWTLDREFENASDFYDMTGDKLESTYAKSPSFRKKVHETITSQDHSDAIHLASELGEQYVELLKSNGHDGVIYKNKIEGGISFIAFHPSQIKLADGTNTTFDAANNDIRFVDGGEVKTTFKSLEEEAKKYKSADEFVKNQVLVYHGTRYKLKQFSNKQGTFFTDDYMNADGYAGGENVYEGYLDFKNPLVIDAKGEKWDELNTEYGKSTQDIVGNVDSKKHDGVIINNVKDNWIDDADYQDPITIYYAFKPRDTFKNESQLFDIWYRVNKQKTSIGTNTTFNPASDDIRFAEGGAVKVELIKNKEFTKEGHRAFGTIDTYGFDILCNGKKAGYVVYDKPMECRVRLVDIAVDEKRKGIASKAVKKILDKENSILIKGVAETQDGKFFREAFNKKAKKQSPSYESKSDDIRFAEGGVTANNKNEFDNLIPGTHITSTQKDYNQTYTLQDIEGIKLFIGDKDGLPFQDGGHTLSWQTIMSSFGDEIRKQQPKPESNIKISAGFAILYNEKILLVHPTKAKWTGSYSILKGEVEPGEDYLTAALREAKEEIALVFADSVIEKLKTQEPKYFSYLKNGKEYKRVYYYEVHINNLETETNLTGEKIEKQNLQQSEIDWAGFVTMEDARERMTPQQVSLLEKIDSHENRFHAQMQKVIAEKLAEPDDIEQPQSDIKYFGKVTAEEQKWLEKKGKNSYSGGELQPIMIDGKMVGGIHWDLGGIDYLEILPEYRGKGVLRKIIMDNIDADGTVKIVTANRDLQAKLTTYGTVSHDENSDIYTLLVDKNKKKAPEEKPVITGSETEIDPDLEALYNEFGYKFIFSKSTEEHKKGMFEAIAQMDDGPRYININGVFTLEEFRKKIKNWLRQTGGTEEPVFTGEAHIRSAIAALQILVDLGNADAQSAIDALLILETDETPAVSVEVTLKDEIQAQAKNKRETEGVNPQLTLLSFGGGQDSWATLYSLIHDADFRKKYAPHDLVVAMSDTGNEFPHTYKAIDEAKEVCKKHNIPFYFLTPDMGYHTPGWQTLKDNLRRNQIVLSASMPNKSCTISLKINVVDKFMHDYMCELYDFGEHTNKTGWKKYNQRFGTKARVLIGFARDEESRVAGSFKAIANKDFPKWKSENIQYCYPLIEEGWNRAAAQKIIKKHHPYLVPPSNCMICFYQSDQELIWLERNYPDEFADWISLENAKLEKFKDAPVNYGVYGKLSLVQKLEKAKVKYGHLTNEELWDYKMSHGHCVKSAY